MLDWYIPIVIMLGLATAFAVFSVFGALMVGPKRFNKAKLDAYECGIEPSAQAMGAGRFPVKYFLTAMLFIVFDIEIIFLYPWAVAFNRSSQSVFLLVEIILFVLTVFVAYAYVWRRGGLEWD